VKTSNQGPLEQAAGRAVRNYLEALRSGATARRSSVDDVQRRLAEIRDELDGAPAIRRLKLVQERHELRRLLERAEPTTAQSPEDAFVAVAAAYSRRHHIAYATWREVGVPAAVLRRAGLKPGGRRPAPRR
jgi:hypothetical protein